MANLRPVRSLSPRKRRAFLWIAGVLIFYTLFGFFILPLIARSVLTRQLSKQLGREVSIAKVKSNPFVLSASVQGLLIKDRDGGPFISWDEVYANFQLSSLFRRDWYFKEIRVRNPYARIQINPDHQLNFADILDRLAKSADGTKPTKPPKPVGFRLDQLMISGAQVALADLTTRQPFRTTVGPLDVILKNFATDPDNDNPYSFEGSTDAGERFSWNGHFFLDPLRSRGDFSVESISFPRYAPLYQDLVRFEIKDGRLDVHASYEFEQSAATNIARITNATVALRSLRIAEAGVPGNALEIPEFDITGASGDVFAHAAEVKSISSRGGRFALRRNQDATVNLAELSRPNAQATHASGGVLLLLHSMTRFFELVRNSTNAWAGVVHDIDIRDYAVRMEDLAAPRPVRASLDQIELTIRNLSNRPGTNISAGLSFRSNTNGTFKADSAITLFPVGVEMKLAVADMELHGLDPYLDKFANLLITGGTAGLDGTLRLARPEGALPELSFQGGIHLDDFATVDGVLNEDLVKWKSLRVSGIDARLNPPNVAVREIALDDAYCRFILETNRTSNLAAVLRRSDGETNATAAPKVAVSKEAAVSSSPAPKLTIVSLVLSNAQLSFLDRSIEPHVGLSLQQLNGTIAGLSSEERAHADVTFKAKVDNTAPIEIIGRINPLKLSQTNELKAVFKNIELSPFGPYVGKYLGYRLNKGRLSLDLDYQLKGRSLEAKNLVNFDQLTLGAKTGSPDATKMPVKLAIAILKDRSGKIELDVPIEGNLDDPEFHYGKVITRAIGNIITKLITSPFSALGALFGGKGEEMSFLEFASGNSELRPADRAKLDILLKGLYERPELGLEIVGSVDPVSDRDALKKQRLEKELRARKWAALRKSEQSNVTPDQVAITPGEYDDYVKERYQAAFDAAVASNKAPERTNTGGAILPAVASGGSSGQQGGPDATRAASFPREKGASALVSGKKEAAPALEPDERERRVFAAIEISDDDLRLLALERAKRVKEMILQAGKIEAERVFEGEPNSETSDKPASRVYFHLQ